MTKKYVSMKLIFSPLEYFLILPQTEALKYIEELKISQKNDHCLSFVKRIISWHLFDFNYFKFENKKYINGWPYPSYYDKFDLSKVISLILLDYVDASEYEMAYELLQNWENIYEISEFNNEKLNLLRNFTFWPSYN
ncbi:unnamed protein product [Blepharisma stoltei]|uniref:Uncharacterized protein n=1 Tax=Blepharisma stoltei TaxID=1481888 RepID=A0AAU9JJH4_9CILI|nr:unnamed protein product [Blepharisma stoltei]